MTLSLSAMQVSITARGARGLFQAPQENRATFYLDHPGRGDVFAQNGARFSFSHMRRYIMHSYDLTSGRIVTQVGLDLSWDCSLGCTLLCLKPWIIHVCEVGSQSSPASI
jgi:hypothetical protein